ncbi:DUF2785 domain-containing protein [Nocardioides sp. AE5]|uniref:DUF2785 domain-containing protein n=1 Tax=Nocardioides sp. AE5 TaxID=2962573 RepID=UPI002882BF46|nr:DUF2785 domain-containing protein [Nocardioides sp. AE5]MDT0200961.1 DUF2785 domain-containing protein [Nocardioides sp. AE5]
MERTSWDQVRASGLRVPEDRPLDELTVELTTMLGSIDPVRRDDTAFLVLATWISRGVYDDLLAGLGDGVATGLDVGLGESGTDSVFRRSFSALVMAECLRRNNKLDLLPPDRVYAWGDRLAGWLLAEQDLRGIVPGKGWAHAVAHGADALAALAGTPGIRAPELTVLLDVIADRVLAPTQQALVEGELDRLASATLEILRRDLVPLTVAEPWVARLAVQASAFEPGVPAFHAQAFLRSVNLQLTLANPRPAIRADLLLGLNEALRTTNAEYLGPR